MKNPAAIMLCGACRVPINPVVHPKPETEISCPSCGTSDTYAAATAICMEEVKERFSRATGSSAESTEFKWRYRETTKPGS